MDFAYIDALNQAYNNFFFHFTASPLLIINTSNIDFVANGDEREEVIDQILDMKAGSNYYQPLGTAEYSKIVKKPGRAQCRTRETAAPGETDNENRPSP